MRPLSFHEFTTKAQKIHGNSYDYSKFIYINNRTKGVIKCPKHGNFQQLPSAHLNGQGCPPCGILKIALTQDEFVSRSKEVHTNKGYDYSKVEYTTSHAKVVIVCPIHGEFRQKPNNHLNGQGCAECSGKIRSNIQKFMSKSRKIHGDRYDYSKFEYMGNKVRGSIICLKHGEFKQTPTDHLGGHGCSSCGSESAAGFRTSTLEEFKIKAIQKHGNLYDYSKFTYKNALVKGVILCPKHGEFLQIPNAHCQGQGCPSCAGLDPKWQREVEAFVQSIYTGIILYNDRTTIKSPITDCFRELDILLPEIKIAFECQGTYFHDEKYFPEIAKRDKEKQQLCIEAGIHLVCLWQHEWLNPEKMSTIKLSIQNMVFTKDGV